MLENASATIKKIEEKKAEISNRYQDKLATSSAHIGFNHFDEAGTLVSIKGHIFSPEYKERSKHFASLVETDTSKIFLVVSVKCKDVAIAQENLEKFFKKVWYSDYRDSYDVDYKFKVEGHTLHICIIPVKGIKEVEKVLQMALTAIGVFMEDLNLD